MFNLGKNKNLGHLCNNLHFATNFNEMHRNAMTHICLCFMIQIAFWLENEKMDENGMFSYLPMGLQVKDSLVQAYGVGQVSLPLVLPPSRSSVEWPSHHLSQQLSQVALVAFMFWFVRHDWSFNPNELRQTCLPTSNSSLKQGLVQESLRDIVTVCDSIVMVSLAKFHFPSCQVL